MCTVSMVMDHYRDEWFRRLPGWTPPAQPQTPYTPPAPLIPRPVTQEEVDEFRRLLERAREYDRKNNEPDCELDEKRRALKVIAERMGVDISFVDDPANTVPY